MDGHTRVAVYNAALTIEIWLLRVSRYFAIAGILVASFPPAYQAAFAFFALAAVCGIIGGAIWLIRTQHVDRLERAEDEIRRLHRHLEHANKEEAERFRREHLRR